MPAAESLGRRRERHQLLVSLEEERVGVAFWPHFVLCTDSTVLCTLSYFRSFGCSSFARLFERRLSFMSSYELYSLLSVEPAAAPRVRPSVFLRLVDSGARDVPRPVVASNVAACSRARALPLPSETRAPSTDARAPFPLLYRLRYDSE